LEQPIDEIVTLSFVSSSLVKTLNPVQTFSAQDIG